MVCIHLKLASDTLHVPVHMLHAYNPLFILILAYNFIKSVWSFFLHHICTTAMMNANKQLVSSR